MPTTRPGVSAPTWAIGVLYKLGAPLNNTNLWALDLWSQSEGTTGNGGVDYCTGKPRYNWLNSTLSYPGSTNCCSCQQGDIQDYPNLQTGVAATADTIKGWPGVEAAFKAGKSLQEIFTAINTSAPGPCAEAGCAGTGNTTYPQAMYAALGSAAPTYSVSADQASSAAGTAAAGAASGCAAKGQVFGFKLLAVAGPTVGLNYCQLKAILGGLGLVGGGVVMLAGGALLVVSGLAGKAGPAQPIAAAALPVARKAQSVAGAPRRRREARQARSDAAERRENAMTRDRARTMTASSRAVRSRSETRSESHPTPPRTTEAQRRHRAQQRQKPLSKEEQDYEREHPF